MKQPDALFVQALEDAHELRRLNAEIERLRADLRLIAETDAIDAALDPQRAIRVARAALKEQQ